MAWNTNLGEEPLFYVTRAVAVKQLIEILALRKAIKVHILLEGKKNS